MPNSSLQSMTQMMARPGWSEQDGMGRHGPNLMLLAPRVTPLQSIRKIGSARSPPICLNEMEEMLGTSSHSRVDPDELHDLESELAEFD